MSKKHFFLTAFAVAALLTASFSTIFASNDDESIKCYDDEMYNTSFADSTEDGTQPGPIIPPIGH